MGTEKEKSGIGFVPFRGYIALAAPEHYYPPKDVILTEAGKKAHMDAKAQECINGKLTVAAIGASVNGYEYFAKVGDVVLVAGHVRPQIVEVDVEGLDHPITYWVVRDSDILVKFD